MIVLHTGKLGVGKSYWATREVWHNLENGIDCFVNWDIDFTDYYLAYRKSFRYFLRRLWCWYSNDTFYFGRLYRWHEFHELYALRRGACFFDEAHRKLNARAWSDLPEDFIGKITQSRKHHLDMHFLTQHSAMVDPVVRRLANYLVQHKRFWIFHYWLEWDGEFIERLMSGTAVVKPPKMNWGFYVLDKNLANCYNSWVDFGDWPESTLTPSWTVDMIPSLLASRAGSVKKGRKNKLSINLFVKYIWFQLISHVKSILFPQKKVSSISSISSSSTQVK